MNKLKEFTRNHPIWSVSAFLALFILVILTPMEGIFTFITGGGEYTKSMEFLGGFLERIIGFLLCLYLLAGITDRKALGWQGVSLKQLLFLTGPAVVLMLLLAPLPDILSGTYEMVPSLLLPMILKYAGVGLIEEIFFRGAILLILLAVWNSGKKGIYQAVLVSSLYFGLTHLVNLIYLFQGVNNILDTVAQVVYAFALGIYFAAMYLRSGNLWIVVVVHALIDISSGLGTITKEIGGAVTASGSVLEAFLPALVMVPFGLYGLFLLRKPISPVFSARETAE